MPALPSLPVLLVPLITVVTQLDPAPEEEDVKAGYPALFLFLGLLAVIGLMGWSLSRHLRRAEANKKAGLFGDAPEVAAADHEHTGVRDDDAGGSRR